MNNITECRASIHSLLAFLGSKKIATLSYKTQLLWCQYALIDYQILEYILRTLKWRSLFCNYSHHDMFMFTYLAFFLFSLISPVIPELNIYHVILVSCAISNSNGLAKWQCVYGTYKKITNMKWHNQTICCNNFQHDWAYGVPLPCVCP